MYICDISWPDYVNSTISLIYITVPIFLHKHTILKGGYTHTPYIFMNTCFPHTHTQPQYIMHGTSRVSAVILGKTAFDSQQLEVKVVNLQQQLLLV